MEFYKCQRYQGAIKVTFHSKIPFFDTFLVQNQFLSKLYMKAKIMKTLIFHKIKYNLKSHKNTLL